MKIITLTFLLCLSIGSVFAQNKTSKEILVIKVPDFADPITKDFYQSYATHLINCIGAIREKNEAKAIALFKDPGEELVAREKIITKEVVKDPVEKQKYILFAAAVYPYIKELQGSAYFKKTYGK